MNKQFGFAKRFKKELMNELVQDNIQEKISGQEFEETVDEELGKTLDDNSEQVLKNDEKEQRSISNHEEKLGLREQKQSFIYVQESTRNVPIVAEMRNKNLKFSNVNFQRKCLLQVKKVIWRTKTRIKNKLRLNMKKILNPKLRKETITEIEDSLTKEDTEDEEDLNSQQVYIEEENSMLLESSPGIDKVLEEPNTFSIEQGVSSEVPVVQEKIKYRGEDDLIFKKIDIPWLSDKTSTLYGGMQIDSETKNVKKTMNKYKYQIGFLSETNDGLVMTNRILREDLDDINTHYQELIVVSKEALKRKRQVQSQVEELNQKVQSLTQQNEVLLKRIKSLETEQQ